MVSMVNHGYHGDTMVNHGWGGDHMGVRGVGVGGAERLKTAGVRGRQPPGKKSGKNSKKKVEKIHKKNRTPVKRRRSE